MNQEATEIDPFIKRVTTVDENAVVIFQYLGYFKDQEEADKIKDYIGSKMGGIRFIVVNKDFNITVLKQTNNGRGALIA